MAEKKIRWTEQQRRAIRQRGSDVLVTASAGTGKTAVLSGRCVDIVSDKTICPDVWSILVLTFTDAAAEQMRRRIAERLRAAFLESGDSHLRHQLMLLQGADISTIHSFCKRLITQFFYKLGLDPTFRVIDADEASLLKVEALEKTIGWAWQQSNLTQGLGQLFGRRDLRTNDGFLSKIIEISNFLDGVIFRDNWYERASALAEAVNPFTTELGEKQKQIIAEKLQAIQKQLQHAQKLYKNSGVGGDWAEKLEETHIEPVVRCIELLKAGDWDKCSEAIRGFSKPTTYKPKGVGEAIAGLIQSTARRAVGAFEKLSELAILNPEYLNRVGGAVGLQTKILIELVKKFDRLYNQAKRAVNCLDFADLEHYALRLLSDENSSEDKLLPSETALALRRKYKYIFVDEYQDINPVQEAILDMVSSADNVFVVGDVKQSIYAFRGAEPRIFIKELKSASVDPKNAPNGLRVDLTANWRSCKGILDFVNKVFGRIMTSSFAHIDYDESAELKPGMEAEAAGGGAPIVELHILDEESKDEKWKNVYSGRQCQAAMIAQRIRQMVGAETGKAEFEIYDKQQDARRDVQYRDIVILMRSPAKRVNSYVEVLRLVGVPVNCEAAAGYFETTEISDLLCLLKVLDNPQRDIELAAVLRSPFFNVSDTELAAIKVHTEKGKSKKAKAKRDGGDKGFYGCVLRYCESGPDAELAGKLKRIVEQIGQWRTLARRGDLGDLIWQIYRGTGFLSFVSALPNGRARRANLLKFHDRAIQFEGFASSSGGVSLRRFVEFIEKLQEAGEDWAGASPEAEVENAVRIMSVHKSKGLEFPVVFLAELSSPFNKRDIQGDCLADVGETLGLQIIDRESNSKLSSLTHQIIAERKLSTSLAEEMRILYVATTRARERLILSSCEKKSNCRMIICSGFFFGDEPVADWQLGWCKSPLEWILYGLSEYKSMHRAFATGLAEKCGDDGDLFGINLYGLAELERLSKYIDGLKEEKSRVLRPTTRSSKLKRTEVRLLSQLKKSLSWRYCFGDAPLLPAKQSVTELTHHNDEYVKIDYSRALGREPKAVVSAESDLAGVVDNRLIGTATHLVISQVDLAKPITKETIEKTKEKLLVDGAITGAVAERINTGSIIGFFESELGRAILDSENRVWREWPFTFGLDAGEFCTTMNDRRWTPACAGAGSKDEVIVVQGIIDMLVRTPKGLLVIDFKTDDITAKEVCGRAELYREQLELYGRAAGAILRAKILGKWLYFLRPGCAIEIKD
jgi:ATP-dependent helicase/nuclease subunit A